VPPETICAIADVRQNDYVRVFLPPEDIDSFVWLYSTVEAAAEHVKEASNGKQQHKPGSDKAKLLRAYTVQLRQSGSNNLRRRSLELLREHGIICIGDLSGQSREHIAKIIPPLGVDKLENLLARHGLSFGFVIPEELRAEYLFRRRRLR